MRCAAALSLALAGPVAADTILSAEYTDPTTRYAHGVLGDAVEWGTLSIVTGTAIGSEGGLFSASRKFTWNVTLPQDQVFEDLAPRLWDVTGDGEPEVVVVLTQVDQGASLVIFGMVDGTPTQIAATPPIGQTRRWLAPVGAADLDGDGRIEIAYVDRPHLAKTLRIWRYEDDNFFELAAIPGLTNHRIGDDFIQGGVRDCGEGPQFVMANGDWSETVAAMARGSDLMSRVLGPYQGREALENLLDCP